MLVYGTGFDSRFWNDAVGPEGRTTFLESNKRFVAIDPGLDAHLVKYHSSPMEKAHEILMMNESAKEAKLAIDGGPLDVWAEAWDIILIDAPKGGWLRAPAGSGVDPDPNPELLPGHALKAS